MNEGVSLRLPFFVQLSCWIEFVIDLNVETLAGGWKWRGDESEARGVKFLGVQKRYSLVLGPTLLLSPSFGGVEDSG